MTTTILIVVNVFAALSIIVLALMQQSKGDMGSAFGGGGSQSMFGSRGSSNFLSRTTAIMCTVFFLSSLCLAYIYAHRGDSNSVIEDSSVLDQVEQTLSETPTEVPNIETENLPNIPTQIEAEIDNEQSTDIPELDLPELDVPEPSPVQQ